MRWDVQSLADFSGCHKNFATVSQTDWNIFSLFSFLTTIRCSFCSFFSLGQRKIIHKKLYIMLLIINYSPTATFIDLLKYYRTQLDLVSCVFKYVCVCVCIATFWYSIVWKQTSACWAKTTVVEIQTNVIFLILYAYILFATRLKYFIKFH